MNDVTQVMPQLFILAERGVQTTSSLSSFGFPPPRPPTFFFFLKGSELSPFLPVANNY
jgi:hypothetical protein